MLQYMKLFLVFFYVGGLFFCLSHTIIWGISCNIAGYEVHSDPETMKG